MSPVEDDGVGSDGRILSARLDNVRLLSDALSCIYSHARKSQDVVLSVPSAGGLKFAVEQPGCLLASVLLPLGAFAHFACADASVRVRLNLSLLLDCLNIFASPAAGVGIGPSAERLPTPVRIAYDGDGHALVLRFAEVGSVTVCRLNTVDSAYAAELETDFQFMRHDVPNMALLESEALRDALAELDYAGATTAELRLAPTAPRFRFQSPAASFRIVDADDAERRLRADDSPDASPRRRKHARTRKRPRAHAASVLDLGYSDDDDDDDDGDGGEKNGGRAGRQRRKAAEGEEGEEDEQEEGDDGMGDDENGEYAYLEPQCSVELADPEDRSVSVFSEFRSARAQTSCYRLELLSRCVRALSMSETCKVQMNSEGMLSVVCRMRAGVGAAASAGAAAADRAAADHCFTEFLIVADEIGDDDDDDDDDARDPASRPRAASTASHL